MLRIFLLLGAVAAAAGQTADFPVRLAQGLMAGEPRPSSVILQSRLTSTSPYFDPVWSGVVGERGWARFEIARSEDFADSRMTEWLESVPEKDFIVKTFVEGLTPGTRYYYRLIYGPTRESARRSATAAFRTPAGRGGDQKFSIAVVTGMNYSKFHHTGDSEDPTTTPNSPPSDDVDKKLGYPALEAIWKAGADYFVATGDNVYYDTPRIGRAETLHQMRQKHQEQYSQPRFLELFSKVGTYWMKDDHDYRFDDADPYNVHTAWPRLLVRDPRPTDYYPRENPYPLVTGSGSLPSHELGIHVFREQLPVVDPLDTDAKTYRTVRVSKSLQLWFVEGRDYRSPNDMPDGPDKTIWGAAQKAWLQRTLLDSDAEFKVLVSATPMIGPDRDNKRDNHINPRGFRHEGDEFFAWLADNDFAKRNLYFACGDRHWKYHAVSPVGFEEFSSGALVDANALVGTVPGEPGSTDPEGKIKHPYHNEVASGGFLLITLNPGQPPTLEFNFFDEKGVKLYTTVKQPAR